VIEVRPAPVEAAPALARIHGEAFDDAWTANEIAALMRGLGAVALAAELEDAPAGFVLCRLAADEAELLTLAVRPALRRRGVAAALLEAAVAAAAEAGAAAMFLEVARDNPAALALYRRGGFRPVGARAAYYARLGGAVDAVVMRRDLNR
jgi:ribosomal-protein-alanine N-acetyltransferase